MTMRTFTKLRCYCGHIGAIVESENDQPYSKEWSSTSVRDLDTKGQYCGQNRLFDGVRPSCPKCGRTLTPENVIS